MSAEFPPPFNLAGEIALVTGGGTGIGLAVTRCLLAAGAKTIIVGRRQDVLDDAVAALGSNASAIAGDINDCEWLPELIAQAEAHFGPLSILVNNAGTYLKKPAIETSDSDFNIVLEVHLSAAFSLAREAAVVMLPRKKGSILFMGSMASLLGIPLISAYTAAKSAVIGLTRALSAEWSPFNIRVNAVIPGWIDTGMLRIALENDPERKSKILERTPMQRLGTSEEIGWAVVYLCSPSADFITGQSIVVDGGASIGF
jgi:NAD(P)-dependent dehydrogenase (short-subunit alcohol dehydrogenase family)